MQENKTYNFLLQKSLSLLSKRRYTVLKLKKKLTSALEKKLKTDPAFESNYSGVGLETTASPDLSELAGCAPSLEAFEPTIQRVLRRLKELKYLDDTAYTKDFISLRISSRPRGKFLLKRELKNKGIHPELAERIVEGSEINEEKLAFESLLKKAKAIERVEPRKQKEKALRFLASRGFKIDAIYKAVDRWYNERS